MASSIHIKKATAGSVAHNSRETHSYSVVFPDEKNECSHTSKEAFKEYRQELAIRAKAYQDRTHQKLQKNAITHLSAVVNLEQHHTLADLETIKKEIEKKFDTKVFQMVVHKDEGKLVSKEDEKLVYTSGEDFFMDPKTQELFWDKKFTKKVDMSQYDIVKNYHAHIEFLGLDSRGEAIKRNYMSKYNLSQLQTFVAKELQMERGKNYYETKEKAPKRLDVLEFKRANTSKRENTQELIKALEDKYKKEREELKASGAAKQADYQALKADFDKQKKELESAKSSVETYKTLYDSTAKSRDFYKECSEKVVEKIVKVEDTTRITELEKEISTLRQEKISSFQNEALKALEAKKEPEPIKDTPKEEKIDSRPVLSKIEQYNQQISELWDNKPPKLYDIEQRIDKRWTLKDCVHWFWAQGEAKQAREERFQAQRDVLNKPYDDWERTLKRTEEARKKAIADDEHKRWQEEQKILKEKKAKEEQAKPQMDTCLSNDIQDFNSHYAEEQGMSR